MICDVSKVAALVLTKTDQRAGQTVEALQSGALYGFAGQVDGIVRRIVAEIGEVNQVIATGGLAPVVIPESETVTVHRADLTLQGLRIVFAKNT